MPHPRTTALRVASELPVGDPGRREILAELQREAGVKDVLDRLWSGYKKKHPSSKKPPQSLIDHANAAGKGGKKEEAPKKDKGPKKPKAKDPTKMEAPELRGYIESQESTIRHMSDPQMKGRFSDADIEAAGKILSKSKSELKKKEKAKRDKTDADIKKIKTDRAKQHTPENLAKQDVKTLEMWADFAEQDEDWGAGEAIAKELKGRKKAALRSEILRIASELPKGHSARRKLLSLV